MKNYLDVPIEVDAYRDNSYLKSLHLNSKESKLIDTIALESGSGVQYYVYWKDPDGIKHKTGRYVRGCIYDEHLGNKIVG